MYFHFTLHAKDKITLISKYGFYITEETVIHTLQSPAKLEIRTDGTFVASSILTSKHVLRVVYRMENDIIIIITCYPGRRKAYGI